MAWPSHVASDFDPGDPAGSISGVPFFQALYDRQSSIAARQSTHVFVQGTTASATYAQCGNSFRVRVPPWMTTSGATVEVFLVITASAAATIDVRLDEVGGTTGTSQQYVFGASGDTLGSAKLTLSTDWSSTFKTFKVMVQTTAGTAGVRTIGNVASGYAIKGQLVFTPA